MMEAPIDNIQIEFDALLQLLRERDPSSAPRKIRVPKRRLQTDADESLSTTVSSTSINTMDNSASSSFPSHWCSTCMERPVESDTDRKFMELVSATLNDGTQNNNNNLQNTEDRFSQLAQSYGLPTLEELCEINGFRIIRPISSIQSESELVEKIERSELEREFSNSVLHEQSVLDTIKKDDVDATVESIEVPGGHNITTDEAYESDVTIILDETFESTRKKEQSLNPVSIQPSDGIASSSKESAKDKTDHDKKNVMDKHKDKLLSDKEKLQHFQAIRAKISSDQINDLKQKRAQNKTLKAKYDKNKRAKEKTSKTTGKGRGRPRLDSSKQGKCSSKANQNQSKSSCKGVQKSPVKKTLQVKNSTTLNDKFNDLKTNKAKTKTVDSRSVQNPIRSTKPKTVASTSKTKHNHTQLFSSLGKAQQFKELKQTKSSKVLPHRAAVCLSDTMLVTKNMDILSALDKGTKHQIVSGAIPDQVGMLQGSDKPDHAGGFWKNIVFE